MIDAPPGGEVHLPGLGKMRIRDSGPPEGDADAPTVLLLHGWTVSADLNWCRTYGPLARRARVVARVGDAKPPLQPRVQAERRAGWEGRDERENGKCICETRHRCCFFGQTLVLPTVFLAAFSLFLDIATFSKQLSNRAAYSPPDSFFLAI